jgi:hypothetical protein
MAPLVITHAKTNMKKWTLLAIERSVKQSQYSDTGAPALTCCTDAGWDKRSNKN